MEANDMKAVETPECATKPLTLDEAIAHANEVAGDCCTACKREHKQLADWLRELRSRRSAERGDEAKLRNGLIAIKVLTESHAHELSELGTVYRTAKAFLKGGGNAD
jgi:hypothetical protein